MIQRRKLLIIFLASLVTSLVFLYAGDIVIDHRVQQKMLAFSAASTRESDNAANRVVMNGKPGALGYSSVYLKYLEDGWIALNGDNDENNNGWKLLSSFMLEPGQYTLTGMKGVKENTIALQLYIKDETGFHKYLYQYNEDVKFEIEHDSNATLHVRVYPNVTGISVTARPAVYRDA